MKKAFFSALMALLCGVSTYAWDFCQENRDGVMLYYTIYDEQSVEVAYCKGANYDGYETLWIPDLVIRKAAYESGEEDTVYAPIGIEPHTFENAAFTYVHIPETVCEIGDFAFAKSAIRSVEFGKEWLFYIGKRAFQHCENLESVTIPKCVVELGEGAFMDCFYLHDLVIEENENLTELPADCFSRCDLMGWRVPPFIKKVGSRCFYNSRVKLVNGIEVLGSGALNSDDGSWESLVLPETVSDIGPYALGRYPPKKLYVCRKFPPYCRKESSLGDKIVSIDGTTDVIPPQYKIIVPIGTKDIYQTTWPWSRYDELCYIQADLSDIEKVNVENPVEESIFTLDGKQIDFKQKGVNIVRYSDGTTKKVLVK